MKSWLKSWSLGAERKPSQMIAWLYCVALFCTVCTLSSHTQQGKIIHTSRSKYSCITYIPSDLPVLRVYLVPQENSAGFQRDVVIFNKYDLKIDYGITKTDDDCRISSLESSQEKKLGPRRLRDKFFYCLMEKLEIRSNPLDEVDTKIVYKHSRLKIHLISHKP